MLMDKIVALNQPEEKSLLGSKLKKSILEKLELQKNNFIKKDGTNAYNTSFNKILYHKFFRKYQAKHHFIVKPYTFLNVFGRYARKYYNFNE